MLVLSLPVTSLWPVFAVAVPVQVGAYFLLWMLGFGVELGWTVSGTHPLNTPEPPKGGAAH